MGFESTGSILLEFKFYISRKDSRKYVALWSAAGQQWKTSRHNYEQNFRTGVGRGGYFIFQSDSDITTENTFKIDLIDW